MCTAAVALGLAPWAMAGKVYTFSNLSENPWYVLVLKQSTGHLAFNGFLEFKDTASDPPSPGAIDFHGELPGAPPAKKIFTLPPRTTARFEFKDDAGVGGAHWIGFHILDKKGEDGGTLFIDEIKDGRGLRESRKIRRTQAAGGPEFHRETVQIQESFQNIILGRCDWNNFDTVRLVLSEVDDLLADHGDASAAPMDETIFSWHEEPPKGHRKVAPSLKEAFDPLDSVNPLLDALGLGNSVLDSGVTNFSWKADSPRATRSRGGTLESAFVPLLGPDPKAGSGTVQPTLEQLEKKAPGARAAGSSE